MAGGGTCSRLLLGLMLCVAMAGVAPARAMAVEKAGVDDDGAVHLLVTICGGDYTAKALPMLRSIIWHRTTPVTFHIIADKPARKRLKKMLPSKNPFPGVSVEYIKAEDHVKYVESTLPKNFFTHMTACSTLRLFAPEIMPKTVKKVIVVDTGDVVVVEDIARLWNHFRNFDEDDLFGATKEMARWYWRLTDKGSDQRVPWWPDTKWDTPGWYGTAERHGINAGVLLLHLERMREANWIKWCIKLIKKGSKLKKNGKQKLLLFGNNGEQDVYNYALAQHKKKSGILYKMPCQWNVQLIGSGLGLRTPGRMRGLDDFNCTCMPPKLLHGNGKSFNKHPLGSFYRFWKDTPPWPVDSLRVTKEKRPFFEPVALASHVDPPPELGFHRYVPGSE